MKLLAFATVVCAAIVLAAPSGARTGFFCAAVDHPDLLSLNVTGTVPNNSVPYVRFVYADGSVSATWTAVANSKGTLDAWVPEPVLPGAWVQVIDFKRTTDFNNPFVVASCQVT